MVCAEGQVVGIAGDVVGTPLPSSSLVGEVYCERFWLLGGCRTDEGMEVVGDCYVFDPHQCHPGLLPKGSPLLWPHGVDG